MTREYALLLFLFFCIFLQGRAQPQPLVNAKVNTFENITRQDTADHRLYRRDYLRLHGDSLQLLRKNKPDAKIILYIDNIPFDDLEPDFMSNDEAVFRFHKNVADEAEEAKAWTYFYKKPRKWVMKDKTISLGYKGAQAIPSKAKVDIVIIQGPWYFVGVGLIAALILILVILSLKSGLLRDNGTQPVEKRPYSLARTQFALWLLLIASAYIFLWISTGEMPVITNSSLILLGISGGTSIIAKIIENSQSLHVNPNEKTTGFMIDILSDEKGLSIHRLQMVVFTLIVGLIFCHDVLVIFEMPEFDNNLLMLMGISSGTYAGFKITENNPTTPVG